MELDVFPRLYVGKRNASIGHGFHVAQHLRRCLKGVNHIPEHVHHDHLKGVLIAKWSGEVDLIVDGDATASSDTVGDGVDQLSAAVPDVHFNIEVLKEGIGKHAVVDLNRVFHAVSVSVRTHGVVQRKSGGRGDASGLNVNSTFWIRWSARRVITISNG